MIVDAHCHVGPGIMNGCTETELLKEMNRLGVHKSIIVPWDKAIAVQNEIGNSYVLDLSEQYPDRFIPFCTVNPWMESHAVEELRKSVRKGAKGLKLHPVYQGFQLTDPFVLPIIKEAVALQIPIYIPTGTPVMSMPLQLKHLAQQFPEGVFIQGHFGSTDFWIDAVPSVADCPNVYVDTAYNLVSSIENAVKYVGAERVIFSSDAPYLSLASEVEKLQWLELPEQDKAFIASQNIIRLLEGGR